MTKQELLKQYPDLVKEISGELLSKLVERESDTSRRFEKTFNKYIKEQVKSEWTILSIRHDTGSHDVVSSDAPLDETLALVAEYGFKIRSVRRESDGEIFTVGDRIEWPSVKSIKYISITSILCHEDKHINLVSRQTDSLSYSTPLGSAVKAKPLFTTEDGVDIYAGNKYYSIGGNGRIAIKDDCKITERVCTPGTGQLYEPRDNSNKEPYFYIFSTKEAAEEYIHTNKPVLSVQDLLEYIKAGGEHSIEGLLALAKSKINAT